MFGQVLGQPDQVGPQAFGADVIRTLGNDAKGKIQPVAVGPPPLPVAGAPGQVLAHQPGQALAVEVGHLLHLVEHLAPLPTAGLTVAGLKEAEVFPAFSYGHLVVGGHRSLSTPSRCPFGNILI